MTDPKIETQTNTKTHTQTDSKPDTIVIGGGIIGLAIALELALHGANVTVLERDTCGRGASWAAAGMLAPEAEGLTGSLLQLSLRSRELYPEWIRKLVHLTGDNCGYWCCGILAIQSEPSDRSEYCGRASVLKKQPGLGESVTGAFWFPQDGQVDNRRLMNTLVTAVRSLGVRILEGVSVFAIHGERGKVMHLETNLGRMQAGHYVLATGAWTRELLPLPVMPRKGQMLSVFDRDRSLQRVLFAPDAYIVPRQDGTIVIGATVEDVGFLPDNTAAGIQALLTGAIRVYPAIAGMPLRSTWWGFRPYAPDEMPLLGASMYDNLAIATGHYRNGILLAPITARLLTDWVAYGIADPILTEFSSSQGTSSPTTSTDRIGWHTHAKI